MANGARSSSGLSWTVLAMVAVLGAWSCSGPVEGPTAPVMLQAPGEESGAVTASGAGKITICHMGRDKQVPPSALGGHLGHGDRLGTCAPAAASCPCFTSGGLADVAAQCSSSLSASCPQQYSLSLFCAPGGGGGTVGNLGLFEARLGTGTCSTTAQDLMTGAPVTTTQAVTPDQYEACRQAIVGAPFYPATCPQ
jgi:hypothetical protein